MKKTIFGIILFLFISVNVSAQTFNPSDFPSGTSTIESIRGEYTLSQIKSMLDNAEIYSQEGNRNKLGIQLTDPITSQKMLLCNADLSIIMFEYIKKLRQEIVNLKQRLITAGIP